MSETDLTATDLINTPQYKVCGVVIDASFTYAEYGAWKDFSKAKGLSGLEARLSKAAQGAGKELRSKEAYETQQKLIEQLEKARDKKLEQIASDFDAWDDDAEEMLNKISARIEAARAKLDTLEPDPEQIIETVEKHTDAVQALQQQRREICLEFVHQLASERNQTKEKLTAWQKKATGQDLTNSAEVCRLGNVQWTSGGAAKRHFQPTPKAKAQLN